MDVYKAHSMLMELADAAGFARGEKFSAEDIAQRLAAEGAKRDRDLRPALERAEEVLALMERPAQHDPAFAAQVQAIGGGVSYGAIMATAEALWRQLLERDGYPSGGEHVHGPARTTVENALRDVRQALSR